MLLVAQDGEIVSEIKCDSRPVGLLSGLEVAIVARIAALTRRRNEVGGKRWPEHDPAFLHLTQFAGHVAPLRYDVIVDEQLLPSAYLDHWAVAAVLCGSLGQAGDMFGGFHVGPYAADGKYHKCPQSQTYHVTCPII